MKRTSETKIINFKGLDLSVDYYLYPGDPGKWTLDNGDPGYPPTPDEIEIDSITYIGGDIADFLSGINLLDDLCELL